MLQSNCWGIERRQDSAVRMQVILASLLSAEKAHQDTGIFHRAVIVSLFANEL